MQYNNTIAILGAGSALGQFIAQKIVGTYRLLLMDNSELQLNQLKELLVSHQPNADIELIVCSKDASWEGDIIIIAADNQTEQAGIAKKLMKSQLAKQ